MSMPTEFLTARTVTAATRLSFGSISLRFAFPDTDSATATKESTVAEEVMKAVIALVLIYIGTFFVAIQGASNTPVEAAQGAAAQNSAPAKSIDPTKEADIRSLLELIGAKDIIEDAASNSVEQVTQRIDESMPNNERAQAAAATFAASFQESYDADAALDQLVRIYDKHFSEEEIKGLLQFYGSPLGQKVAAEMPKISRELQTGTRSLRNEAVRQAWQQVKAENPSALQGTKPFAARRHSQQGRTQPANDNSQQAQSAPSQP
jgi:hypothetical protein